MSVRTLVLGGIRSGKSRWAEKAIGAALHAGEPVRYLATGPTGSADPEWSDRVDAHRDRRPAHWTTVETNDLPAALGAAAAPTLVDDVGGWLTAVLDRRGWDGDPIDDEIAAVLAAVSAFTAPLMLVSPEVGLSVLPATAAGRRFADELGGLNQRFAAICERVVLVVAGCPVEIKAVNTKPAGPVGI